MTDTNKRIPHSECIQGRCMNVTTGCWGECSIRAAFPLNNVACGDPVTQPRVSEQADAIQRIVDRDTPPDNRGEVVDYDIRGNPITRGDVARFAITQQAAPEAPACRMQGGICACRSGGSFGGCAIERGIVHQGFASHAATTASASIDTPEFSKLMGDWAGAAHSCDKYTREIGAKQAWSKLTDYIDNRTAHPGEAPAGGKGQA